MIVFNYVRYKNFLSSGNAWTHIDLNRSPSTLIVGENGAGKSTFMDALCFGLFGKAFRKINKPQLVNSINERDMAVEIDFRIGTKEYRVVRGIKPWVFQIFLNDELVEQTAANKDYQDYLERRVLKLNFNSFKQVVMLGSSTFVPFMQLSAAQRREVIEDLLDIKIFTVMNVLLRDRIQTVKDELNALKYKLDLEAERKIVHQRYIAEIKNRSDERVDGLKNEIQSYANRGIELKKQMDDIDVEIERITDEMKSSEALRARASEGEGIHRKIANKLKTLEVELDFYQQNDTCPTCKQDITADHKKCIIGERQDNIDKLSDGVTQLREYLQPLYDELDGISDLVNLLGKKNDERSTMKSEIQSLKSYIKSLKNQLSKETENTASVEDEEQEIVSIDDKIDSLKNQRQTAINDREVLMVVSELLKDKGIKARIVRQYIPIMNQLINKYLAKMEFFVQFELDENFNEIIRSRYRDDFSYASFSEGEKSRLDLALMLTWRSIAKMKNSVSTNLLILDEIFDGSLDVNGLDYLSDILGGLTDTNLFVISHKGEQLQDKFYASITFEKQKDFSVMLT